MMAGPDVLQAFARFKTADLGKSHEPLFRIKTFRSVRLRREFLAIFRRRQRMSMP